MEELPKNVPGERRRTPRVFGTLVDYTLEDGGKTSRNAFIKDISMQGICIYIPEHVKKDDKISLNIFLYEDDQPIKVRGKIIWSEPGGYLGYNNVGVEFTEFVKEDKKALAGYIEENYKGD